MLLPVLLAGGEGSRLWPLSNRRMPKQFLSVITNDISFYQATIERVIQCIPTRKVLTITTQPLVNRVKEHHKPFEAICKNTIIQEPFGRNTAAATILAALYAEEHFGGNTLLWVVPSDHVVKHTETLKHVIECAIPLAEQGHIITFGVSPNRADPNYGYIIADPAREEGGSLAVKCFMEKPAVEVIGSILQHRACFWNSGMFVFSADTILQEMEYYQPSLLRDVTKAYSNAARLYGDMRISAEGYADIPALPVDKVIMEHSTKLKVIPATLGWMDVGSWQSLWEFTREHKHGTMPALLDDAQGECGNCLAYLNRRFALETA